MSGFRFDRLLAGTALALVLAAGLPAQAEPENDAAISAAVPLPEPAGVPPLTPADIGAPATPVTSAAIPLPEPAGVAPLTPADVDPTTTATVPAATAEPATRSLTQSAPAAAPAPASTAQEANPGPAKEQPAAAVPAPQEQGQTASVAPAAPSLDQQVGDKIREMLAGKSERLFERKTRTAVEAYYQSRAFAPLWSDNGAVSARGKAVIAELANADADGLDPADYQRPDFAAATPDALAEAELKLTSAVLTFARHAAVGRVHYSRISQDIVYDLKAPEPADVLAKLGSAQDARAALDGYLPQHPAYKALKQKLAEIRGTSGDNAPARIAAGPVLKVGMEDARVPQLRERLGVTGVTDSTTYDKTLAEAVKKFQRQRELSPTGTLTSSTVDAMNGPRRDRASDIIVANLERWRWIAHDLGPTHVVVNIPEYVLRLYDGDAVYWQTRVVVGKPTMPTPLLSETMKYITVNPTWNVPPSIINNEYIPVLKQDPDALARIGLKVEQNRDGTLHIYQPPGERNALGRIRFNFPNKFLVYQHDTPDKNLFANDKRAYSHGCMRVQFPDKYAEALLALSNPKDHYSAERIRKMYGTSEQQINLNTPIPVHLTYQTAYVDEAGKLVLRDDIYGRDSRVIAALKSDERKVADLAVERRENPSTNTRRQVYRMPDNRQQGNGFFLFNLFR